MPEPSVPARWTPETEQRMRRAIVDSLADDEGSPRPTDEEWATTDPDEVAAAEDMLATVVRPALASLMSAGLLVTPELTAVREAARALTAEDLELAAITDEWVALYDGLAAAVDALEARTTGAET